MVAEIGPPTLQRYQEDYGRSYRPSHQQQQHHHHHHHHHQLQQQQQQHEKQQHQQQHFHMVHHQQSLVLHKSPATVKCDRRSMDSPPAHQQVDGDMFPSQVGHGDINSPGSAAAALLTLTEIKSEPSESDLMFEPESEVGLVTDVDLTDDRLSNGSCGGDSSLSSACEWLTTSSTSVLTTKRLPSTNAVGASAAKRMRLADAAASAVAAASDSTLSFTEKSELCAKVARLVSEVETLKGFLSGNVRFNLNQLA